MEDRKFVNNQQPIYATVRRVTTGFASHIPIFTFFNWPLSFLQTPNHLPH